MQLGSGFLGSPRARQPWARELLVRGGGPHVLVFLVDRDDYLHRIAVALVERLSNVQAVSLLKHLAQKLYGAVPYSDVRTHLPTDMEEAR